MRPLRCSNNATHALVTSFGHKDRHATIWVSLQTAGEVQCLAGSPLVVMDKEDPTRLLARATSGGDTSNEKACPGLQRIRQEARHTAALQAGHKF